MSTPPPTELVDIAETAAEAAFDAAVRGASPRDIIVSTLALVGSTRALIRSLRTVPSPPPSDPASSGSREDETR